MREFMSVGEAAEVFGATFRTIHNWARRGKIRAVKIGGKWFIQKAAISELLANGDSPTGHNNE